MPNSPDNRAARFFRGSGATIRARDEEGSLLVAECYGDKSRFDLADRIVDMLNRDDGRATSKCRRCSECPGADHHWMWNGREGGMPGGDPNDDRYLVMECKHCDAIRKATDDDMDIGEPAEIEEGDDDAAWAPTTAPLAGRIRREATIRTSR